MRKQYRPRSDAIECGIWSGSALFATNLADFSSAGSKKDQFKILGQGVKVSQ